MRATEAPIAVVAVPQSAPRTAGPVSRATPATMPMAAIVEPVRSEAASTRPVPAEAWSAETQRPVGVPSMPVPASMPPAAPAATIAVPAVPASIAKPAAAPAKPGTRAPVAKAAPRPLVPGQRLAGRLELAAGPKQAVAAGEVAQGVVYFLPRSGGARPRPGRFTVDTQSKGFSPSLLVVPVDSTVSFPNRDQILHNVFSKTPGAAFDLGYYGPGTSRETRFSKPGLVVVNCSVHNAMRSNVLVLATPYYTRPGRDGRFSLAGLPPGPGTLVFWHPRANAQSLAVTGPVGAPLLRRMVATRAPLDRHRH